MDGSQLAVYAHAAATLYLGRPLLQLVYTIWFPERPPQAEGNILAGKLDGITWRVTLAPDGEPLIYDAMHPCGCYQIESISVVRGSDSLARYELRPYAELRSMQRLDGGRAGVFGADGLVGGTERAERFVFWPMGIASAGAMRQWGRQATAFVGRRHFDDADLFEKRFRFDLR